MAIDKFKIVNSDGSTNQSEYNRCIQFLNNYVNGVITVTPETTWENPLEVDMSQDKSAFEMLNNILTLNRNRLLTKKAYNSIKKLFKGLLDYYGAGIYANGSYISQSKNFLDGPGTMYDVFTDNETEVQRRQLSDELAIFYRNDDYKTVIGYEDTSYISTTDGKQITWNTPVLSPTVVQHYKSNIDNHPNVYKGNPSGVYTPFYRLCGQYIGSSTLFYYSECNDTLYTSGLNAYSDSRINEIINPKKFTPLAIYTTPSRGVDLSMVSTAQNKVNNPQNVNASLSATYTNTTIPYTHPTKMTAAEESEWIIEDET